MSSLEGKDPSSSTEASPEIEDFLGQPTRDLHAWYWLWDEDRAFPIRSHRGGRMGRLVVRLKRWFRPWVKLPLNDLWDRQRAFNLTVIGHLERLDVLDEARADLHRDLLQVRADLLHDVRVHHGRITHLEETESEGFSDVMRHGDALYSLVDQKLDRYHREGLELRQRIDEMMQEIERLRES